MSEEKKPVIVYGGSFDPPHRGHAALAAAALRQLDPAFFYFVPGFRTPFKDFMPVPYGARAAMLRAAMEEEGFGGDVRIRISPFEAARRRVVYTWETLSHFRRLHPRSEMFFLMGSDCLEGFSRWRRPDLILRNARLLVGPRPGYAAASSGVPFSRLAGSFPEADSTGIRARLFLGGRPAQLQRSVQELLEKKSFYLFRERALLRELLSPRRYEHTLLTAELALQLAGRVGVPQRKAALAALLHDCARDLPLPAQRRLCPKNVPLRGEMFREAPLLAHVWAGAELARKRFSVRDPEVLGAIRLHATGAPGMGPLARLVYISDLANRGRSFREASLVRRLAVLDPAAAFRAANYVKLVYAFSAGGWVHPLSVALWNSLREEKKG